jgi:gliding motility-associated-like protein
MVYNKKANLLFQLLVLILFSGNLFCQGESNKWYFGFNTAIDFNSGFPIVINGSAMNQLEGCASIADAAGNLLFYTNGVKVWDKNNVQMPNGFSLLGGASSTQSALVLPKPGSSTLYYLFTAAQEANGGIAYSMIDMTLNGGNGDIVSGTKNTVLLDSACEKLTAIKQCNGEMWVIVHKWNSNAYYSFLLTSSGISAPVISNIGVVCKPANGNNHQASGYLKASSDGKKLAAAISYKDTVQLFDFNNATGIISNPISISYGASEQPYGIAFSPDNQRLYVSISATISTIYQYDISSNSESAIVSSQYVVTAASAYYYYSIQIAPDNKLYISTFSSYLDVINNPNASGAGCSFVDSAVFLGTGSAGVGLPNFAEALSLSALNPVINSTPNPCLGGKVILNAGDGYTSYLWFPTSDTLQTIIISTPGSYTYSALVTSICGTGADTITFSVDSIPILTLSTTFVNTTCGKNNGSISVNTSGGTTPYEYSWSPPVIAQTQTIAGLESGTYTGTVTDLNGCVQTQTVVILPSVDILFTTASISAGCTAKTGTATAIIDTGTPPYSYLWNTGATTQTVVDLGFGTYTVTVTDSTGCVQSRAVECKINDEFMVPNAFSPNNDNHNDFFVLQGWANCIAEFHVLIYDRWGEKIFETQDVYKGWNGTYGEKPLDAAVFVYYINAALITGEKINRTGNITLIR